jgi:hypothetical protein
MLELFLRRQARGNGPPVAREDEEILEEAIVVEVTDPAPDPVSEDLLDL